MNHISVFFSNERLVRTLVIFTVFSFAEKAVSTGLKSKFSPVNNKFEDTERGPNIGTYQQHQIADSSINVAGYSEMSGPLRVDNIIPGVIINASSPESTDRKWTGKSHAVAFTRLYEDSLGQSDSQDFSKKPLRRLIRSPHYGSSFGDSEIPFDSSLGNPFEASPDNPFQSSPVIPFEGSPGNGFESLYGNSFDSSVVSPYESNAGDLYGSYPETEKFENSPGNSFDGPLVSPFNRVSQNTFRNLRQFPQGSLPGKSFESLPESLSEISHQGSSQISPKNPFRNDPGSLFVNPLKSLPASTYGSGPENFGDSQRNNEYDNLHGSHSGNVGLSTDGAQYSSDSSPSSRHNTPRRKKHRQQNKFANKNFRFHGTQRQNGYRNEDLDESSVKPMPNAEKSYFKKDNKFETARADGNPRKIDDEAPNTDEIFEHVKSKSGGYWGNKGPSITADTAAKDEDFASPFENKLGLRNLRRNNNLLSPASSWIAQDAKMINNYQRGNLQMPDTPKTYFSENGQNPLQLAPLVQPSGLAVVNKIHGGHRLHNLPINDMSNPINRLADLRSTQSLYTYNADHDPSEKVVPAPIFGPASPIHEKATATIQSPKELRKAIKKLHREERMKKLMEQQLKQQPPEINEDDISNTNDDGKQIHENVASPRHFPEVTYSVSSTTTTKPTIAAANHGKQHRSGKRARNFHLPPTDQVVQLSFSTSSTSTTLQPTTVEPTTVKPTTVKPTTVKPTTVKPTTVKPTTVKPTTVKPTTVKPTTVKPTTTTTFTPVQQIRQLDKTVQILTSTTISPATVKPTTKSILRPVPRTVLTSSSTTSTSTTVKPTVKATQKSTWKTTPLPSSTTASETTTVKPSIKPTFRYVSRTLQFPSSTASTPTTVKPIPKATMKAILKTTRLMGSNTSGAATTVKPETKSTVGDTLASEEEEEEETEEIPTSTMKSTTTTAKIRMNKKGYTWRLMGF